MKWANKKQNNFNIYNVAFLEKKIKKNTCRNHYQNLDDMIYSYWDIKQNKLKLLILGHFLPFYPPKDLKNQNFEKWKSLLEISLFYTCVPKITNIWCVYTRFLRYGVRWIFFVILGHFLPFYHPSPNDPENQNFEKNVKKIAWMYYPFIDTCLP